MRERERESSGILENTKYFVVLRRFIYEKGEYLFISAIEPSWPG